MLPARRETGADAGFTLLELATVIVVIAILATMMLGSMASFRARAEKVSCASNLRSLHAGVSSYIQSYQKWPQIEVRLLQANKKEYARQWVAALSPYGITQRSWVCPTQHRMLGEPDLTREARADYNATPFDSRPRTPFQWSTQPWFVEHASVHDGGPLLIYPDGAVLSLSEALKRRTR